jgi:transmembrane sensor
MSDHGQDHTNASNSPPDWEALARVLANESTAEEATRVRAWLAAHPAERQLVERLDEAARPDVANVDIEAALNRVRARMEPQTAAPRLAVVRGNAGRPRRVYFVSALAIAAAAAFAVVVLRQSPSNETSSPSNQTYATTVGQRDSITLPDSSRVILGPMSRLAVVYGKDSRSVELQGDAFFDVRHDASKPFSVRVGRAVVEDIGTTFTIESDAGDTTNVSVITGSVRLRSTDSAANSGAVLAAGDRGSMAATGEVRSYPHTVTEDVAAWTSGKLVFKDASLIRVVGEIRRWYGVTLRISDSSLADRHLSFDATGEPVEQVLKIIGLDLGARIERQGDTATVTPIRGPNSAR